MTGKLTFKEVLDLIETAWNIDGPSQYVNSIGFEIPLLGADERQVRSDVESYLATIDREIDPDSIRIEPDALDDPRVDSILVTIMIGL